MSPIIPRPSRNIDTEEAKAILRAFLDGRSIEQLRKDFHRAYESIVAVFDEVKVRDLPALTGIEPQGLEVARQLYLRGYQRSDIARRLEVPIGPINLATYGMVRHKGTCVVKPYLIKSARTWVSEEDKLKIVDLYHVHQVPKADLCRLFNRTEPTIRKILEAAGVFRLNEALSELTLSSRRKLPDNKPKP